LYVVLIIERIDGCQDCVGVPLPSALLAHNATHNNGIDRSSVSVISIGPLLHPFDNRPHRVGFHELRDRPFCIGNRDANQLGVCIVRVVSHSSSFSLSKHSGEQ
jgi:hypothetical protein